MKVPIAMLSACAIYSFSMNSSGVELGNGMNLTLSGALLSDYRSHGVSQTKNNPALQVQAVLAHDSGLFLGLWGSNVDFNTKTRVEEGYYVGYAHVFSDDVNANASLARYEYPKDAAFDTNEFYGEINAYKFKLSYVYDYGVDHDVPNIWNASLGYNFSLPYDATLLVSYGLSDMNFDFATAGGSTRQKYNDWEARVSKKLIGVDWSLSYIDTDLSRTECINVIGMDDVCAATVVLVASKSF